MKSLTLRDGKTNDRPFFENPRRLPRTRRGIPLLLAFLVLAILATPYLVSLVPPPPPRRMPGLPAPGITVAYYADDPPGTLSTTVTKYPSSDSATGTNCAADNGAWTSRTEAYVDNEPDNDATSAQAAPGKNQNFCDDWKGFGFAIPPAAPILSVTVAIEYRVSTTLSAASIEVGIFTTHGPTSCARFVQSMEPTAYTLFGNDATGCKSWTAADFNNDVVGVSVAAVRGTDNDAVTFYLDYISIAVTYVPDPLLALVAVAIAVPLAARRSRGRRP